MGKCKYRKICNGYDKDSRTCNKASGFYLRVDKPCGFYREFESKKSKKIISHANPLYILNPIPTTRSIEKAFLKLSRWFLSHWSSSSSFSHIRERVVPFIIRINKKEVSN